MTAQYLHLLRRIAKLNNTKFAGFRGPGIQIYAETNYRNPNAKVKAEVNWSSYGTMDFRQAAIFNRNFKEAIAIAKSLSYKFTSKELKDLLDRAYSGEFRRSSEAQANFGGVF